MTAAGTRWVSRLCLILSVVLTIVIARDASATSCTEPRFEPSFKSASFVFSGRVTVEAGGGHETVVKVVVDKIWKGEVPAIVRVHGGGMSGASFENGKSYLVFAGLNDGDATLFAHLCGGTMQTTASDWLAKLGEGRAPSAGIKKPVPAAPSAHASVQPPPVDPPPVQSAEGTSSVPIAAPSAAPSADATAPPTSPTSGGCAGCNLTPTPSQDVAWALAIAAVLGSRMRRGAR